MNRLLLSPLLALAACFEPTPGLEPVTPVVEVAADEVFVEDTDVTVSETLALPEPDPETLPVEPPTADFELRRGETLAHYARWSGLPIEAVAAASGLSPTADVLPVGTVVKVPADEALRAVVEARREAHRIRRAEGYLDARGGAVGTEFYTVRTGDNATSIARDHAGIPVWLVETYNPSVDLERLRPGQELLLPIVADSVAEAPVTPAEVVPQ